jgi:hypothetical protein
LISCFFIVPLQWCMFTLRKCILCSTVKGPYHGDLKMSVKNINIGALTAMIVFIIGMVFLSIQFFSTPFFKPISLVPVVLIWLWVFLQNADIMPVVHPEKVVFKTGVTCTIGGTKTPLPGGKFKMLLWVKKRFYNQLYDNNRLEVVNSIDKRFIGMLLGDVPFFFVGDNALLHPFGDECELLPDKGYRYEGSLTGLPVKTEYHELLARAMYSENQLSKFWNTFLKLKEQVDLLSKSQDKTVLTSTQKIGVMMKDILESSSSSQRVQHQQGSIGRSRGLSDEENY